MVTIDLKKCIGCAQCVEDCPGSALVINEGKVEHSGKCILCGHCVAICPCAAVSIPEYDMAEVEAFDKSKFGFDIETLLHTIKFRRSIRSFTSKAVEQDKLENLVQAGRYTATGINSQGCRFIIVQNELVALKEKVWSAIDTALEGSDEHDKSLSALRRLTRIRAKGVDFLFRNAPVVLYIAANSVVDAGLAAQNIEMAAVAQGLGVLYNGYLAHATAMSENICGWLETDQKPIAVCMLIGYPEKEYKRTVPRRKADARWM